MALIFLADKSAWEQTKYQKRAADRMTELRRTGELAICPIVAAELLYSSRNHEEFLRHRAGYDRLLQLDTTAQVHLRLIDLMQALARQGHHRSVGIPDLLIAATAEAHGATVLHYDSDFERVAELTGQPHEWIVPRGEGH